MVARLQMCQPAAKGRPPCVATQALASQSPLKMAWTLMLLGTVNLARSTGTTWRLGLSFRTCKGKHRLIDIHIEVCASCVVSWLCFMHEIADSPPLSWLEIRWHPSWASSSTTSSPGSFGWLLRLPKKGPKTEAAVALFFLIFWDYFWGWLYFDFISTGFMAMGFLAIWLTSIPILVHRCPDSVFSKSGFCRGGSGDSGECQQSRFST